LEKEVSVFVSLNNHLLEEAFKGFLEDNGFSVASEPEGSKIAIFDGVKLAEHPVKELASRGVNILLLDNGLTETQLYFLVKNFPLSGIISSDMSPGLLKKCLNAVLCGDKWFKRDFLVSAGRESVNLSSLTKKEKKVIDYLIEGMTNKEIAWELGVTEQTVKYYVNQLLKKTNCSNRVRLVCFLSQIYPYIRE
jgi:DNA-binding CsgD family transcriptional regulator